MMRGTLKMKSDPNPPQLDELCDMPDAAHAIARSMPKHEGPSLTELAQAVATAHFCAHRLAAERASDKRKSGRKL